MRAPGSVDTSTEETARVKMALCHPHLLQVAPNHPHGMTAAKIKSRLLADADFILDREETDDGRCKRLISMRMVPGTMKATMITMKTVAFLKKR